MHLLFYNWLSGAAAVGFLDRDGSYHQTDMPAFRAGWFRIVAVGDYLFFYDINGFGGVGLIDRNGAFQPMHSLPVLTRNLTEIVSTTK